MNKQVIRDALEMALRQHNELMEKADLPKGSRLIEAAIAELNTPAPQSALELAIDINSIICETIYKLTDIAAMIQAYVDSRVQEALNTQIAKLGDRLTNGNTDWHNWMRDTMKIDPKDTKSISLVWAVMSRISIDPKMPCDDCPVNQEALEKERAK